MPAEPACPSNVRARCSCCLADVSARSITYLRSTKTSCIDSIVRNLLRFFSSILYVSVVGCCCVRPLYCGQVVFACLLLVPWPLHRRPTGGQQCWTFRWNPYSPFWIKIRERQSATGYSHCLSRCFIFERLQEPLVYDLMVSSDVNALGHGHTQWFFFMIQVPAPDLELHFYHRVPELATRIDFNSLIWRSHTRCDRVVIF